MKSFFKGVLLGLLLFVENKLCSAMFDGISAFPLFLFSGIVFGITVCAFLISKNITELLLCGFTGLFVMFFIQIRFIDFTFENFGGNWLKVYVGGFYGSVAAVVIAIIMTAKKVRLSDIFYGRCNNMQNELTNQLRIKLVLYALISAMGFSYLVLPENASISVPLFVILQFVCLWFCVPNRRRLFFLIPIAVMSLNCFLSASHIWRTSNLLISFVLFSCAFMPFNFKSDSLSYLGDIGIRIITPFAFFGLPFKWLTELSSEKAPVVKRVVLALAISLPCALVLLFVLSRADMVFSLKTESFFTNAHNRINIHTVFLYISGIVAGLFLFSVLYCSHTDDKEPAEEKPPRVNGDLIIINIFLAIVLFIYSLFVIIQFKYLFAGSALPEGLTYTEYARKGFFELLALTGVNIATILAVIKLTKLHTGKWFIFAKVLCHYLCAVTVILLISSFYRMWLYTNDDGLTRLRFFVMGFLVFEAIGLLVTFRYIAKPNINITLIYICLAMTYYMLLNIIPTDRIIAENQIKKYLCGERENIYYVYTLSADAAPALTELYGKTPDETTRNDIIAFLERVTSSDIPERWQRYNLSTQKAKETLDKLN